jgi:hypothetical protein
MWKYILAVFLILIGSLELTLSFNERLREALMQNSLVRSKRAEPTVLLLAGLSAIVTGVGIILFDIFW